MYGIAKRLTAGLIAGVIVTGSLVVSPGFNKNNNTVRAASLYDSASAINYATILGGAVDYGVVANEITSTSHTETTFATNRYVNNADNSIDVDYVESTALFLVGDLGGSHRYLKFGKTKASAIYLEAPANVYGNFDSNYIPPAVGGTNGNIRYTNEYDAINHPFIQAVNENASVNVNRLINRICSKTVVEDAEKGWSYFLQDRATDPNYAIDLDGADSGCVSYNGSAHVSIDLTSPEFDNRVVYINIDSSSRLLSFLTQSDGFNIIKNPSSVVVINIEDDAWDDSRGALTMKKPKVSVMVNGSKQDYVGSTMTNGKDPNAKNVQKYYNESIIWNIMEKSNVQLEEFGGAILAPATKSVTLQNGNSSGWVVTGGSFHMNNEFHFLYSGASRDAEGQMHFALTKAFTEKYAAHGNVKQDTSVDIPDDNTYKFYIQEYEHENGERGDFYDEYGSKKEAPVLANGTVTFPLISFTCNDSNDHYNIKKPLAGQDPNYKMFYFRITEDTSSSPKGISNSDGYIDIRMKVQVDSKGKFTYFVDYKSVTGKNPGESSNIVFRKYGEVYGDFIKMSGVQFDLGAFYNLKNPITVDISKRDVNKPNGDEIPGAKLTVTYVGTDGNVDLSNVSLICDGKNVTDSATLTKITVSFESGDKQTSIVGLKPGQYTLTETTAPEGFMPQTTVIKFTIGEDGTVIETELIAADAGMIENGDTVVILDERYKARLPISKIDSAGEEVPGATLTLTAADTTVDLVELGVTATQGTDEAKNLKVQGNSVQFETIADYDTVITNLPDGQYTLTETTTPFGYQTAESQTISIKNGKVAGATPVVMVDRMYKADVTIRKVDSAGKEVAGAVLTITSNNTNIDLEKLGVIATQGMNTAEELTFNKNSVSFKSQGDCDTVIKNLPDGVYTLTETTAPFGYKKAESQTITITKGVVTNAQPVIMVDEMNKTDLTIRKIDSAGKEVPGAVLTLTNNDKNVDLKALGVTATQGTAEASELSVNQNVVSFKTLGDCDTIIKNLPDGTYTLVETTVPDGFERAESQTITIKDGAVVGANPVTMVDAIVTPSPSPSASPSPTVSPSPSPSASPSPTVSPSPSPSASPSPTVSPSPSPSASPSPTVSPSPSPSASPSPTVSPSPSPSASPSPTVSPSPSPSASPSPSLTVTPTPTDTVSPTPTEPVTLTPTPNVTSTPGVTMTPTPGTEIKVEISKQDIAGKELAEAELTITSLDGYDLSGVVVTQGGKVITIRISDDKTSISFYTVDSSRSVLQGLMPGRYELKETVTPKAYLTADAIRFTLNADGSTESAGKVTVAGSPIVMVDKADPNYETETHGKTPMPATGEQMSYAAMLGVVLLGLGVACLTGFGVYRSKRKRI